MNVIQYWLRYARPAINGHLTKFIYFGSVKFGKNLRCDSIPKILIDKNCKLQIGSGVEFRRNVEIRVHNNSSVIIENDIRIDRGVRILSANNAAIILKTGVRIGLYSVLNGGDDIYIGNSTLISGFVYLQTSMHKITDLNNSIQKQGFDHAPIFLQNDVWLGTHAVIMPGVTIEKGAVVGSNAVVTRNVESYSIIAGVPAKLINVRK